MRALGARQSADWAMESFKVAKNDRIMDGLLAECAWQNSAVDTYIAMAIGSGLQLSKAGVRLAFMLNLVLGGNSGGFPIDQADEQPGTSRWIDVPLHLAGSRPAKEAASTQFRAARVS